MWMETKMKSKNSRRLIFTVISTLLVERTAIRSLLYIFFIGLCIVHCRARVITLWKFNFPINSFAEFVWLPAQIRFLIQLSSLMSPSILLLLNFSFDLESNVFCLKIESWFFSHKWCATGRNGIIDLSIISKSFVVCKGASVTAKEF